MLLILFLQELQVLFKPGVLVVGPDPNDGLLQRNLIFYYQLTTTSSTTVQDVNTIIMKGLHGTVHVHSHKNTVRILMWHDLSLFPTYNRHHQPILL